LDALHARPAEHDQDQDQDDDEAMEPALPRSAVEKGPLLGAAAAGVVASLGATERGASDPLRACAASQRQSLRPLGAKLDDGGSENEPGSS
jgi:hypothetical protein